MSSQNENHSFAPLHGFALAMNSHFFGCTSRRTSFNSANVENDLHCESEVALVFVESCTYEVGFRRSPAPKWAAHGHAGLID